MSSRMEKHISRKKRSALKPDPRLLAISSTIFRRVSHARRVSIPKMPAIPARTTGHRSKRGYASGVL
jgi:hypothetical protein